MQQGYTIYAYSPSLNEEHRLFELANMSLIADQTEAQKRADAFAGLYNRDAKNQAQDWVGRVKFEQVGIDTITGFIPPNKPWLLDPNNQ